jgi:hypothetical protein
MQPILHDPELNDAESLRRLRAAWVEAIDQLSAEADGEIFVAFGNLKDDNLAADMLRYAEDHGVRVVVTRPADKSKKTKDK